jgi:S-adenosylmethionine hydrolase
MAIALLTDFGTRDYYVAAMKGAILSIDPQALIIDVTHDIQSQDVRSAAFVLEACYRDFPRGTIFVAVADPGVGSSRKAIATESGGRFFLAPDNGLLSFVLNEGVCVYEISEPKYLAPKISNTFHGRDVFAPASAHLSLGVEIEDFGPEFDRPVVFPPSRPISLSDIEFDGEIVHIDRFGNLITNFRQSDVGTEFEITVGEQLVTRFCSNYAESLGGELFAVVGSTGAVEISISGGSAAVLLNCRVGQTVVLKRTKTDTA